MVKIVESKIIIIDHAIYMKLFYNNAVYYITVSLGDVLNDTNNYEMFQELKHVLSFF